MVDLVKVKDCCEILDSKRIPITASKREKGIYPYYGANGIQDHINKYLFDDELVLVAEDGGNFNSQTKPIAYRVSGKCWVNNHAHVLKPKSFLDVDYLCYALAFYKVGNLVNGATRKKLTQKALKAMTIPIISLPEQKMIVNKIKLVKELIKIKEQELSKLDTLIKARFVEMFGDPMIKKDDRNLRKLKEICIINPKKNLASKFSNDIEVSFVPMSSVSEQGDIDVSQRKNYSEVRKGFTYFAENDVLFAKITPCMENGKGAIATGLINGIGFGSTEFHILRPIKNITNPYWIYVLTSFKSFRKLAEVNMTGSAGQRRVPATFLKDYEVRLPPIELQNEFASFVQQVDKSKVAIQKSLDETQILFDSLMQKYFS